MSPIFVICAAALFAQAVYCIPCGGSYIPVSSGCGGNLGLSSVGIGSVVGSGLSGLGSSSGNTLSIATSSPAYGGYPSGVALESENDIGGSVAVSGSTPFVASTYFGGNVPSNGQASLSYSAGPAGLNGGGCGQGWSGSVGSVGSVGSTGLGNLGLGLGGSCGCRGY